LYSILTAITSNALGVLVERQVKMFHGDMVYQVLCHVYYTEFSYNLQLYLIFFAV